MLDYFMGVINTIDDEGITITHTSTGCKNYIFLEHVVAIHEEQVLYEDNPEHKEIIDQYRKEKPISAAKHAIPQFVDPAKIAQLKQKAQELTKS